LAAAWGSPTILDAALNETRDDEAVSGNLTEAPLPNRCAG